LIDECSPYEIRAKILSVLDPRNDLHYDYREFHDLNLDSEDLKYLDEIATTLRNYVRVADTEVKTHGEVMTPIPLVEDMLNTFPSDVWTDPNKKWLDPCAGVGTFYSVVVQRLMKGLKKAIPNKNKRYRHIIENMLFACELQAKNMFIYHCIFDRPNIFELNTFYGSFLSDEFNEHMTNVWGVEKFDIILGNPPYQTQKEGNTKTHPLWHLFVNNSLDILIDGGYLNMVHPSGWRNVGGTFKNTQKLMTTKEIQYLEMHTFKDGLKTFGAKINYDFYCLKNVQNHNYKTKIVCEDGSIVNMDLSKMEFIPGENIKEIYDLVAKDDEEKVNVQYDCRYHHQKDFMSKVETNDNKYPCVYMVNYQNNPTFWYSNINKGHFDIPKIIWGNGSSGLVLDINGEYGTTEFASAIIDDRENLPLIYKALKNERFISKIMLFKDGLGDKYNRKVIATFRKDFYKQFLND
jgi:hypothetical protein